MNDDGLILYTLDPSGSAPVVREETARDLQVLMRETVSKGSARASFKKFARNDMRAVYVGGKTGSLTGENPQGRYDWFVGYATKDGRKLAFAAMCINKDFWYVKSAYVARRAIEYFFRDSGEN